MFLRRPERFSEYLIYFFMMYGVIALGTLAIEFFIFGGTSFKYKLHGLSMAVFFTLYEWLSNAVRKENQRRESEKNERGTEI